MRFRKAILAALLVFVFAIPARADNRLIVRTTLGLQGLQNLLSLQQLCGLPSLQVCNVIPLGDPQNQVFLVTTPLDPSVVVRILQFLPGIVDAELDQLLSLLGGLNQAPSPPPAGLMADRTSVPYYGAMVWNSYANQTAAQIVRVSAAQSQFQIAGSGIVADIDTGVDPNHPALAGVLLPGYDFTRNQAGGSEITDYTGPTPQPCPTCSPANVNQSSVAILDQSSVAILDQNTQYAAFGHGTMVMGIIHLVAPQAKLLPLKAFSSNGTGSLADIIRAIYYAVQNHANVINMSFDFSFASPEFTAALNYATQSALVCAASAGNDGQKEVVYPAALQSMAMGVASTNDNDARSSFSNYGDAIVWVAAPGEGIITTYPFNTYSAGWGTSFSAPFVSGTSALLFNKQSNTNESQVAAAVAHAVPIGADMGNGRLDIVQALTFISPVDFSISPNPASLTITAGQAATYALTVTPASGFNQLVTLSCSDAPPASTCVATPSMVTPDGLNPVAVTVTVQTTARAVTIPTIRDRIDSLPWELLSRFAWLAGWIVCPLIWTRRGRLNGAFFRWPDVVVAAGLLAVSFVLYSCTGATTGSPGSASLASVTVNPTNVNAGSVSTGAVTLSGPAPSGGAVVSLSTSNAMEASVPGSVTVAAGATSATFTVTAAAVTTSTSVTLSAAYAGVTRTASLTVTPQSPPPPSLASLVLNPTSVNGGSLSTGTVMLTGAAPSGGVVVSLSSGNTAVATVPVSVTVPSGIATAPFPVSTLAVTASASVTISASYSGDTRTASLTVTPQVSGPTLSSITLNPASVNGRSASAGTVALSGPAPAGGALVSLSSSNTAVATLPASVSIPTGATSAPFTLSTLAVTAPTSATISASYAGVTQTAPLTVTPAPPAGTPAGTYTLTITGTSGSLSHQTTVTLVVN